MPALGLAAALAAGLFNAGCPESLSDLVAQCEAEKKDGTRTDSPGDCGCNPPAGTVCAAGDLCIQGVCCDPSGPTNTCAALDAGSHTDGGPHVDGGFDAGPPPECDGGECSNGCVPMLHETDVNNCWCSGPCGSGEMCSADAGNVGAAACVCDPLAHLADDLDCGCHGRCVANKGQSCVEGICECDPASCGEFQSCASGSCACDSSLCPQGDTCVSNACACDEAEHATATDCGCPPMACATGKACKAAAMDAGHHCG